MPVVGRNCYILSESGKYINVSPFTLAYKALRAPVVDAVIQYDSPYDGKSYILVIQNTLHVPSMTNNLIPPFMLREAAMEVNDKAKIHMQDPTTDDHVITFSEMGFKIPLSLSGIFSYFTTTKLTNDMLQDPSEVYILMPARWDPHSDVYAHNEDNMLDWEGNMKEPKHHDQWLVLDEVPDDEAMASSLLITEEQCKYQEENNKNTTNINTMTLSQNYDQISSVLSEISSVLDQNVMCNLLEQQAEVSAFQEVIGSTDIGTEYNLIDGDSSASTSTSENDELHNMGSEDEVDFIGQLDESEVDQVMAGGVTATTLNAVDTLHLSKIWRISTEDAKRMLVVTSQYGQCAQDPTLSQNYGTNDHMLQYQHIHEHFFMDTFFTTSKGGKSTHGNTCCQHFVMDKGYLYVVPMKCKGKVLQAIKQLTKEIGVPDAIVANMAKEQLSQEVKHFCNLIGTTLQALEEGTPWSNQVELYIKLMKEAICKDMWEMDSPMVLWDYCLKCRVRIYNLMAWDHFKVCGTNPITLNVSTYGWYEWCYYREHTNCFPHNQEVLGWVLGPARGEGNEMAQWILKANGNVVPRHSHCPLQIAEINSPMEAKKHKWYNSLIERRWGISMVPPNQTTGKAKEENFEIYEDDNENGHHIPDIEDSVNSSRHLLNQLPAYDRLLNAEVQLELDNEIATGKVVHQALGPEGIVAGKYDDNPILNSMMYKIEFIDGQLREYSANEIA